MSPVNYDFNGNFYSCKKYKENKEQPRYKQNTIVQTYTGKFVKLQNENYKLQNENDYASYQFVDNFPSCQEHKENKEQTI